MPSKTVYFLEPDPDGDKILEIAKYFRERGYKFTWTEQDILLMLEAKQLLKDKGARDILSRQLLIEEVLPDNTSRGLLLDTLMYKLDRCAATTSLLLIDPYLYPSRYDASYESDLLAVLTPTLNKIATLRIATRSDRDVNLETRIDAAIRLINPRMRIERKYTDAFHDRFWIADDARGIFLGTSFSGIGKRYALIDYLSEDDTQEIVGRYQLLP